METGIVAEGASGLIGAMVLLGMAVVNIPAGLAITLVAERQVTSESLDQLIL